MSGPMLCEKASQFLADFIRRTQVILEHLFRQAEAGCGVSVKGMV